MGIEIKVRPIEGNEHIEFTYKAVEPEMDVTRQDGVRQGSIEWDGDLLGEPFRYSLHVEAGADISTPIPGNGGYASIGAHLYLVDMKGPQSLIIEHDPLQISLKATDR